MLQDRFGVTEHQEKFMRSLPKSWEGDNWSDPDAPRGGAVAWAVIAAAAVVAWLIWRAAQ